MRISEKMGLVYTALFLTVSIALITQNADRIMAGFRGESAARAVDDIFTVQAGRTQRLDVLANDLNPDDIGPGDIRLLKQPACGRVAQVGGGFDYTASADCTGYQAFSYCIDTGRQCPPASVALRLIPARAPKASIGDQAISAAPRLNGRVGIASGDLEISNIHLGRGAGSESRPVRAPADKLALAAVEAAPSLRQTALSTSHMGGTSPAVGMLSTPLPAMPANTDDRLPLLREASAGPLGRLPNLPNGVRAPLGGPVPPGATDIAPGDHGAATCNATVSARAVTGAMVALTVVDACQPGVRVVIQHGRMRFATRLGADGRLALRVPALEKLAHFRITLPKGEIVRASVEVPDIKRYDRVVFLWRGRFDVTLAPARQVANAPAETTPTNRVLLGDETMKNPVMALVYTRNLRGTPNTAFADLALAIRPGPESCGQGAVLQSLRATGGRMISASGLRFRLPGCDSADTTLVLKNVARDLIIASR